MAGKDLSTQGPMRDLSQEIGQDAEGALQANRPKQWSLVSTTGADYGFDYQVMVFGPGTTGAQLYFNLQLKGSTQPKLRLADGVNLSHPFGRTTLNLWHGNFTPVLVAVVDFVDERDPKTAEVYYEFVSPNLDELLEASDATQASITIRIPRANRLRRDLDIFPVLAAYKAELEDARRQLREKRRENGTDAQLTTSSAVSNHAGQIDTSGLAPIASGIEALIARTNQSDRLKSALAALRAGDATRALEATWIPSIDEIENPTLDVAVNAYLRAKVLSYVGDQQEAQALFEIAMSVLSDNDDVVGSTAQIKLDKIPFDEPGRRSREELMHWLRPHSGPTVKTVMAKLYALEGDFDSAREVLKGIPDNKAFITGLVVSIIERSWQRVVKDASAAPAELTPVEKFVVQILKARAHFQIGMGPLEWPDEGKLIIPAAGLPGMNIEAITTAFEVSLSAMRMAQTLGWPEATNHLLDVLPICAMVVGRSEEAVPLLADLGRARNQHPDIREAVVKLALNADHPSLALELIESSQGTPAFENQDSLAAVAACGVGNVAKAFTLITPEVLGNTPDSEIFLSTLMIVGVSADAGLRNELLEQIRSRLAKTELGTHYLEILNGAVKVRKSALNRVDAVQGLAKYWRENGKPPVISRHILINSSPTAEIEADILVEVANYYSIQNALDSEQWANYSQALLTSGMYGNAVIQLRAAVSRFSSDARLESLLAVALDMNGDASESYRLLERLVESGEASDTARRYFINSAARMGWFEAAAMQVRNALARSTDRVIRLRHLNTLYQLSLLSASPGQELWDLAWDYGSLADKDLEQEEGIFLQEVMFAMQAYSPDADDARLVEFSNRRDAYIVAFPTSKYLRKFELPEGDSAVGMMRAIQSATGLSENVIERAKGFERRLDAGSLQMPFSWRPRHALLNVPDVLALWHLRRGMPIEKRSWHFETFYSNFIRGTPNDLSGWEPVLSLVSLLVLNSCNLLERFIGAFGKVVVARGTLLALQNARSPLSTGYASDEAASILSVLQHNFGKVTHPPYLANDDTDSAHPWEAEDSAGMGVPGRIYVCDDVLEAAAICGTNPEGTRSLKPSMSTVDFLRWAEQEAGTISVDEVAIVLAHLIDLKIGIEVEGRYIFAAIPKSLQEARNRAEADRAFASEGALKTIIDGVWSQQKPFVDLRRHFSAIFAYLFTEGGANDLVLEVIWARWLEAVRTQTNPPLSPMEKLASSFVAIALLLPDYASIARLWSAFWKVIETGLPEAGGVEADRRGIQAVAAALGSVSVSAESLAAADLSVRIRASLGSGTSLDELYAKAYIDAAAHKANSKDSAERVDL